MEGASWSAGPSSVLVEVGVKDRRSGGHGLLDVVDARQLLVLHLDQKQCLLGCLGSVGCNGGHLLADESHHVPRQHRQVAYGAPHHLRRNIEARKHGSHTRQATSLGGIDAHYAGMRQRAAQAPAHKHTRRIQVSHVGCPTGDLVRAFQAANGLANYPVAASHNVYLAGRIEMSR